MPPGSFKTTPYEPRPEDAKEIPSRSASNQGVFRPAGFAKVSQTGDGDVSVEISSEGAGEPWSSVYPRDGGIRSVGGQFGLVAYAQPESPLQPLQPLQPLSPTQARNSQLAGFGDSWGASSGQSSLDRLSAELASYSSPVAEGTSQAEATVLASSDLGSLLSQSSTVQSVEVQRRSPIALDPNVRGFKAGQIYTQANGVYWTPARRDLDTMLSKIDPGMIQEVVVIPGPYGLRYGPGFSFIDIQRAPAPRYAGGYEVHFDTTGDVRTNGGQIYGRETVEGGSKDWGYRFSYGHRKGSDYTAGNGLHIPSSYENRDLWGELSYDINPHQRVDFAYQRLDQTDTEYPGQFFDVDYLGTYGFECRLTDDDPSASWTKLTVEGWYNHTGFDGDTSNSSIADFPVMQRVEYALNEYFSINDSNLQGQTNGAQSSAGARSRLTFGEQDEKHVSVGADFRYLSQRIVEDYVLTLPSSHRQARTSGRRTCLALGSPIRARMPNGRRRGTRPGRWPWARALISSGPGPGPATCETQRYPRCPATTRC